jgi:biofilm PGA synthesis N-glycosyltransferase PgaC
VVLILDADAQPTPNYLEHALPLFDDPEVAAVAGHATAVWYSHRLPRPSMLCVAYRVRLYRVTQALMRYGQTWKHSNVSFIVPGFASMYRCSVLPHIDIDAPGLIIEDFNMTFELHHKRLGKIAYSPKACGFSHEPLGLRDYVRQVRRWYLGFWQTIRRHGFWPSAFWLSLGTFVVEMLLQSVACLLVPLLLAWFTFGPAEPVTLWLPQMGEVEVTAMDLWIGVFLLDYFITFLVSTVEKKRILLLYGLGFPLLRWIDAFLFLYTLPLAFAEKSDGRWVSPRRGR